MSAVGKMQCNIQNQPDATRAIQSNKYADLCKVTCFVIESRIEIVSQFTFHCSFMSHLFKASE